MGGTVIMAAAAAVICSSCNVGDAVTVDQNGGDSCCDGGALDVYNHGGDPGDPWPPNDDPWFKDAGDAKPDVHYPDDGPRDTGLEGPDGQVFDAGPVPGCGMEISPVSAQFEIVQAGCQSSETKIILFNRGAKEVSLVSLGFVQEAKEFILSKNPPLPYPLASGDGMELRVKFRPGTKGLKTAQFIVDMSCGPQLSVNLQGIAVDENKVTDVFTIPPKPMTDILLCIDNSKAMTGYQERTAELISDIYQQTVGYNANFNLGVVTAEAAKAYNGSTGDRITPGVLFSRAGNPRVVTNYEVKEPTPAFLPIPVDPAAAFTANAAPGACCAEKPSCFEAIRMALSDPLINDDAANNGFLREAALLAVIVVSDTDDMSGVAPADFAKFMLSIKGEKNTSLLSFSVIAGLDSDFDPANPTTFPGPKSCGGESRGASKYAEAFKELYKHTGRGLEINICGQSGPWFMRGPGAGSWIPPTQYFLTRPAVESTIKVFVDKVEKLPGEKYGYTYDRPSNSIIFGPESGLEQGSRIEVGYTAQCNY
ncbi:MAG: hypothetical protein WC889_14615 [Myxococcota bacterium]